MGARASEERRREETNSENNIRHQPSFGTLTLVLCCALFSCLGIERETERKRRCNARFSPSNCIETTHFSSRLFFSAAAARKRMRSIHHSSSSRSSHYAAPSSGSERAEFHDRYQNRVSRLDAFLSRSRLAFFQYAWLEKNHVTEVGSTYKTLGKQVDHKPSTWRCEDQAAAGK